MERGIIVTGGGALLRGLDQRLMHETGMSIVTADHPLQSVVLGSGAVLEEFDVLHAVLQSSGRL
jgi:rod shape-determining protein MreB